MQTLARQISGKTNLVGAELIRIDLRDACLIEANLSKADLGGAKFNQRNPNNEKSKNPSFQQNSKKVLVGQIFAGQILEMQNSLD